MALPYNMIISNISVIILITPDSARPAMDTLPILGLVQRSRCCLRVSLVWVKIRVKDRVRVCFGLWADSLCVRNSLGCSLRLYYYMVVIKYCFGTPVAPTSELPNKVTNNSADKVTTVTICIRAVIQTKLAQR